MPSRLSDVIIPFDKQRASFKQYIVFVNDDGCKVHVPFAPTTFASFYSEPEKTRISELNKKMITAFSNEDPEYGPLLLPNSEFAMKVVNKSRRVKYIGAYFTRASTRPDYKRSKPLAEMKNLPPMPTDLSDLECFSKAVVAKRTELDLNQRDVARSLRLVYGLQRSSTMVSRVERMDMSLSTFLKVYPIFYQWLKDTEDVVSRQEIVAAALGKNSETPARKVIESVTAEYLRPRTRTVLSLEATKVLEAAFVVHHYPPVDTVKELADKLGVTRKKIRTWFSNRRIRSKRPHNPS